jgi:hypothetical protein
MLEDQSSDGETIRRDLAHMLMIKSMLDDQIGVLESLREIFEHGTGLSFDTDSDHYEVDKIDIPVVSKIQPADVRRLGKLISERKRLRERFIDLITAIRKMVRASMLCWRISVNSSSLILCKLATPRRQHKPHCSNSYNLRKL